MIETAYPWDWRKEASLDERSVSEARNLAGTTLRRSPFNSEASRIAIVRFARGIGDRNPLWLEEEYGKSTRWGSMVAHPMFLYSVDDTVIAPGLRGMHSLFAGSDWEFFKTVRLGDMVNAEARLLDVSDKHGRFCGRMVMQTGELTYRNQRGELVARVRSQTLRTPRAPARERGKYLGIAKHHYSSDEMMGIEAAYDAEQIRGANPRYWEDVQVGEQIPPIVKGPLQSEDMLRFVCAVKPVPVFGRMVSHLRKHPADFYLHPETGLLCSPMSCMLEDAMARDCGFPIAHDSGVQRVAWLGSLITNWSGDDGFLRRLQATLLLPNMYGDTTWCQGRVEKKHVDNGDYLVECDIECRNQRMETTATGKAVVRLPSRTVTNDTAPGAMTD